MQTALQFVIAMVAAAGSSTTGFAAFAGSPSVAAPAPNEAGETVEAARVDECRDLDRCHVLSDRREPDASALPLDPCAAFDRVVERYRDLAEYEDSVIVEQITARSGERAVVEETHIRCEVRDDGGLSVTSPQSQTLDAAGVGDLFRGFAWLAESADEPARDPGSHPATSSLDAQYSLWLAPHMALRYAEEPLAKFRSGVDEGFTPVKAEKVKVDERELLRLDLQSGDGLSDDYRARFELFIDPETLLITRVRGVQLLPDGANLVTDFAITLKRVVTADGEDLAAPNKRTAI